MYVDGFQDGTFLLRVPHRIDLSAGGLPPQGLRRDTAVLLLLDPATEKADTMGAFAGEEAVIQLTTSGGELRSISVMRPPFLSRSAVGVAGAVATRTSSSRPVLTQAVALRVSR
jgi:hypothetical protein